MCLLPDEFLTVTGREQTALPDIVINLPLRGFARVAGVAGASGVRRAAARRTAPAAAGPGPLPTFWISTSRWAIYLVDPHDRLSAVKGAVGTTLDEALDNLAAGLERFGSDEPASPRWPQ